MLGSFLLILRHLLLDHPGIDPVAAYLVVGPLPLHLPQQPPIPPLEASRRRAVAFRQPGIGGEHRQTLYPTGNEYLQAAPSCTATRLARS